MKNHKSAKEKSVSLTKKELRRSEQRFRQLVEVSSQIVWIANAQGDIIEDSPSWRAFTGKKYNQLAGWSWVDVIHPDDREQLEKAWRKSIKTATPCYVEFRELDAKGEYRNIVGTAVPIFDEKGSVAEWVGMNQDITEQKKAEEALRESERRLKKTQEIAHLGSWELDLKTNKLTWSDEAYRIFGLKPQQFDATYEAFLKVVHPNDRKAVDNAYSSSLNKRLDGYEIEHRIIRKQTGEIRFVHEKCEHTRDKSGKVVKSIGMVHDITEYKKIEEKLASHTRQLEFLNIALQEALVKEIALLESIGDGVLAIDKTGKIIALNKKAQSLFNWQQQYMIGKPFFSQFKLEDENGKIIPRKLRPPQMALTTAQVVSGIYFINKKNIKQFPLLITSSPVILNNEVVGAVTVYRDVSQQVTMDKAKDEFVSVASHELRTPLSTISWSLERLYENYEEYSDTQKKSLDQISRQTKNMIRLTNDLLVATRVELGVYSFKYEEINPLDVVKRVIENLIDEITEKKIRFNSILDKNIPVCKIYSNSLNIILENLLSNAVKYTSTRGKITLRISKNKKETEEQLILQVTDSGLGMPKSVKEKIFQKGYRANNVKGKFEGSGLGLYITKAMVDHMEGEIIVKSKRNKGSTFTVILPFVGEVARKENRPLTDELMEQAVI